MMAFVVLHVCLDAVPSTRYPFINFLHLRPSHAEFFICSNQILTAQGLLHFYGTFYNLSHFYLSYLASGDKNPINVTTPNNNSNVNLCAFLEI